MICGLFISENDKILLMSKQIKAQDKIIKSFVFQKQETHQSSIIQAFIKLDQKIIDLTDLLEAYCPPAINHISIYDPNSNKFVSLGKTGTNKREWIPIQFFQPEIIMIRYRKGDEMSASESEGNDSSFEQKQKKDRHKERTILEVIEVVKQWRQLHLNNQTSLKKMNLQDAARAVGVSKKSLDDYYYQLRLGEFYSFDFHSNLNQKIGVLRNFVKEYRPEKQSKNRNQKHPKNLKIIEEMTADFPKNREEQERQQQNQQQNEMVNENENSSWNKFDNPLAKQQISSYEDQFYKNFQFLLDEPNDPFLSFERNFKKKASEMSNELFFFD